MIPILYDSNEVIFASNGLCRLRDTIEAKVVEERNGVYELDFSYPIDGANFDLIQIGRIVGVSHDAVTVPRTVHYRGPLTDEQNDLITDENGEVFTGPGTKEVPDYDIQPFDIVSYSRPIEGIVTFHCTHISYRQSKMVTYASNITSLASALGALRSVFFPANPLGQGAGGNPFTYRTDMSVNGYVAAFDGTPRTIRSILGGMEGSILDTFGGEFEWDRWTVILHKARGIQRDFSIRYGVNMTKFQDDTDCGETFNTCVPFWKSGSYVLKGGEVSSGQSVYGSGNKCLPLDLTDKFETQPSVAQLQAMAAKVMNEKQPYLPKQTINVDFVRLQDEAGFDEFDRLLECKLCDSIKVIFPGYDMSAYYKIVKTTWNVLLDRYEDMELGNLSTTLSEALGIDASGPEVASVKAVVVEQGTNGIWTYRKWSDGTAECWGVTSAEYDMSTAYGGAFYSTGGITFPSGLFVSEPTLIANRQGRTPVGIIIISPYEVTSTYAYYFVADIGVTHTESVGIAFYAAGRWQ